MLSDYPDPDLVENIEYNIKHSLSTEDAPKAASVPKAVSEVSYHIERICDR